MRTVETITVTTNGVIVELTVLQDALTSTFLCSCFVFSVFCFFFLFSLSCRVLIFFRFPFHLSVFRPFVLKRFRTTVTNHSRFGATHSYIWSSVIRLLFCNCGAAALMLKEALTNVNLQKH